MNYVIRVQTWWPENHSVDSFYDTVYLGKNPFKALYIFFKEVYFGLGEKEQIIFRVL